MRLIYDGVVLFMGRTNNKVNRGLQTGEERTKRHCKWELVCPMRWFYQQGQLDKKWIVEYCQGDWEKCKRYELEEKGIYHPDNMLPNGSIDESLHW